MRYAYFDSEITGVDEEGMPIFDRAENSEMFATVFSKLITNGVLAQPADCFQVLAGSGLAVNVRPGFAVINGRFAYETMDTPITLTPASSQYARIDRVVLRCNYLERLIEIVVKPGTPSANPVAPELLQPTSGDYYELGLATVRVAANATALTQSMITDTRADSSVCGIVTQLIDRVDTSVFATQLNSFYNDLGDRVEAFEQQEEQSFTTWFNNLKAKLDANAAAKMQVQLDAQDEKLLGMEIRLAEFMSYNESTGELTFTV